MTSIYVYFGKDKESQDKRLLRVHLEKYSRLYQDMVKETDGTITDINMPNLFNQFDSFVFERLTRKIEHIQDSELYDDGLLLADTLDMEEVIKDEVNGYNLSFDSITFNPRIWKIYLKYSKPYFLLNRMKNSGHEMIRLAQKHLNELIKKEKEQGYPSNMTLYQLYDKSCELQNFNLIEGRFTTDQLRKNIYADDIIYDDIIYDENMLYKNIRANTE